MEPFSAVIITGTMFSETWVLVVLAPAEVIDVGGLFPEEGSATWAGRPALATGTFPLVLLLVFLSLVFLGSRRRPFVVTSLCKRLRW